MCFATCFQNRRQVPYRMKASFGTCKFTVFGLTAESGVSWGQGLVRRLEKVTHPPFYQARSNAPPPWDPCLQG
jgi:hypothetical protein